MKIKIQITEDDIKNGVHCKTRECPAALAIKRKLKDSINVLVYYTSTFFEYMDDGYLHHAQSRDNPKPLMDFISKFDERESVSSIDFTLDIPKEYLCE